MAMQVNSLSMANSAAVNMPVAAPQELPLEKRMPLPREQRSGADIPGTAMPAVLGRNPLDTPVPGQESQKSQTQNLKQTTSELERISLAFNRRLKFEIDQQSRDIRIKVIDNETDKVIKVLPPEELQRLHSRIRETLGFLFDKMV